MDNKQFPERAEEEVLHEALPFAPADAAPENEEDMPVIEEIPVAEEAPAE